MWLGEMGGQLRAEQDLAPAQDKTVLAGGFGWEESQLCAYGSGARITTLP